MYYINNDKTVTYLIGKRVAEQLSRSLLNRVPARNDTVVIKGPGVSFVSIGELIDTAWDKADKEDGYKKWNWSFITSIAALNETLNEEDFDRVKEVAVGSFIIDLGDIFLTEGVYGYVESKPLKAQLSLLLSNHRSGSWGNLDDDDLRCNIDALKDGHRVFSKYDLEGEDIYIITEADRSTTTVMFPHEY